MFHPFFDVLTPLGSLMIYGFGLMVAFADYVIRPGFGWICMFVSISLLYAGVAEYSNPKRADWEEITFFVGGIISLLFPLMLLSAQELAVLTIATSVGGLVALVLWTVRVKVNHDMVVINICVTMCYIGLGHFFLNLFIPNMWDKLSL